MFAMPDNVCMFLLPFDLCIVFSIFFWNSISLSPYYDIKISAPKLVQFLALWWSLITVLSKIPLKCCKIYCNFEICIFILINGNLKKIKRKKKVYFIHFYNEICIQSVNKYICNLYKVKSLQLNPLNNKLCNLK